MKLQGERGVTCIAYSDLQKMTKFFDTDSESGNEGLGEKQDQEKSAFALKAMFDRGLIDEQTYRQRLKDLGL